MNKFFLPYLRKLLLVFFDDILVYNRTMEDYQQHIRMVFESLRAESLFCNRKNVYSVEIGLTICDMWGLAGISS